MRWALLLVAAQALLRKPSEPCRPCTGLLEGAEGSPCGCGFGLVRKVHTRAELESMSQVELDKLLRDSEEELDELKGSQVAQEKEHKKALEGLNESTSALRAELWGKAGDAKQDERDAHANYTGEGDAVAALEEELKTEAHTVTDLKYEFSQVHEDLGYKLMVLSNCDCSGAEASLLHKKALQSQLLALRKESKGPGRVKLITTAMEIEKVEAELVTIMEAMQAEQSAYDAGVRELGETKEALERNSTSIGTKQVKSQDLLDARVTAQGKAKAALERMVSTKKSDVESIKTRLADAKEQVSKLEKELGKCGCKS